MYKLDGMWFADDLYTLGHYLVTLGESLKAAHEQEDPDMVLGPDLDRVAPGETALGEEYGGIQFSTILSEAKGPARLAEDVL